MRTSTSTSTSTSRITGTGRAALRGALRELGIGEQEAHRISRRARLRRVRPGEQLCRIGGLPDRLLVLVDAEADAVLNNGSRHHLEAGAVIGEISLLGGRLYQVADVTVTRAGSVITIDASTWRRHAGSWPTLAGMVGRAHTERVARLDAARHDDRMRRYEELRPTLQLLGLLPAQRRP